MAALSAVSKKEIDDLVAPAGLIRPPLDTRLAIERVAGYIGRNGPAFLDRLKTSEANNAKFAFLNDTDPYNEYFKWRLSEFQAGNQTLVARGRAAEKSDAGPAVAQQTRDQGPPKPADDFFTVDLPPHLNELDHGIIKITAEHAAGQGEHCKAWLTLIAQRQAGNPQFDFLRPNHSLHSVFAAYLKQFQFLMSPEAMYGTWAKQQEKELDEAIANPQSLIQKGKDMAEYMKWEARQKETLEAATEKEQLAFAQIDWHDFVVVETVTFTDEDDEESLPPPVSLNDLKSASMEQKQAMSQMTTGRRIEEAMPTDDMDVDPQPNAAQTGAGQNVYNQTGPANLAAPSPYEQPSGTMSYPHLSTPPVGAAQAAAMPISAEDDRIAARNANLDAQAQARAAAMGTAPMNIRQNWSRTARQPKQPTLSLCPNCKQMIPVDEMTEHLRIEMLDPRWREQRQKEADRHATTNLSTADVAQNLKRLASQRTDVFDGVTGEKLSEEEKERRKKAATGYDGVIPGILAHGPTGRGSGVSGSDRGAGAAAPGHSTNLQEQLRHIQNKAQQQ